MASQNERRDLFAAAALHGLLVSDAIMHTVPAMAGPMSADGAAQEAVKHADALIAELDKTAQIDGRGAEVEELAALANMASTAQCETEIENEALRTALRELVSAGEPMRDPRWAGIHAARAAFDAAMASAREVLSEHKVTPQRQPSLRVRLDRQRRHACALHV